MSGDPRPVSIERTYLPRWLLGACIVVVATILLWPTPVDDDAGPAIFAIISFFHGLGWTWFGYAALEITANVLLFIPLGVLLVVCLPRRRWWLAIVIGVGASLAGEAVQALLLPERVASANDVVANSIGTVLGVSAAVMVRALRAPSPSRR